MHQLRPNAPGPLAVFLGCLPVAPPGGEEGKLPKTVIRQRRDCALVQHANHSAGYGV